MAEAKNKYEVSDEQFAAAIIQEGDSVVVDLQGIEEAKFENIPKGIYTFEVDACEYGLSKAQQPMLTLSCRVADGDWANRKLPYFLSFSQKALPFTKAAIARAGWGDIFGQRVNLQQIADGGMLLGRQFRARVGIQEYEGQDRNQIQQILPANKSNGAAPGAQFA